MLPSNVVTQRSRTRITCFVASFQWRYLHYDGRNRISNFWAPTQRQPADLTEPEHGHDLLARAGFLRQAHSGIFHLLPLGLRVQNKIERLIDKHMLRLGASKVSLSSLSSEELWKQSGRLDKGRSSELLQLTDRKGAKYLLSPTHEEEITTVVANAVHSYKELPLRLYQVSRKYRDELRPRQGLLRGREFLMKDLYTFDATDEAARKTYEEVRKAYVAFLEDLGMPFLVARADSGNMGGTLSHEYHFDSEQGEDTIISCDSCDYSINEELYVGRHDVKIEPQTSDMNSGEVIFEHYVSKDRQKLVTIQYASNHGESNIYAVKAAFPEVDTGLQGKQAVEEYKLSSGEHHTHYVDPRIDPIPEILFSHLNEIGISYNGFRLGSQTTQDADGNPILLTKARKGDTCPQCAQGHLNLHKAVEIGHTFHLGTRYSVPLEAQILNSNNETVPIAMGCHGIGVSRLIGATAALLSDEKGLNWPLSISPFEAIVVPAGKTEPKEVEAVYDHLVEKNDPVDAVIDDRERPLGWKLNDADLIGYPFIIVVGNKWREREIVELQCRQLGVREEVGYGELLQKMLQYRLRL